MASFANRVTFFFFLVQSFSVHIQARQGIFFSKFFHTGAKISTPEVPISLTPASAPEPAPAFALAPGPANSESQFDPYYGLYGHGQGTGIGGTNISPEKETGSGNNTPTTFDNELLAEELDGENYENGYDEKNKYYNNNNNGYTEGNNYNNNEYTNGRYSSSYKNDGYNNNGYESERQGMSDTRFVEDGKYYYDGKSDNYYPNSNGVGASTNEFSSMGEFQNNEEYVP